MTEQTELDIRLGAMQQEYMNIINTVSGRCVVLAAELAATQAKLKTLETEKANANPAPTAVPAA